MMSATTAQPSNRSSAAKTPPRAAPASAAAAAGSFWQRRLEAGRRGAQGGGDEGQGQRAEQRARDEQHGRRQQEVAGVAPVEVEGVLEEIEHALLRRAQAGNTAEVKETRRLGVGDPVGHRPCPRWPERSPEASRAGGGRRAPPAAARCPPRRAAAARSGTRTPTPGVMRDSRSPRAGAPSAGELVRAARPAARWLALRGRVDPDWPGVATRTPAGVLARGGAAPSPARRAGLGARFGADGRRARAGQRAAGLKHDHRGLARPGGPICLPVLGQNFVPSACGWPQWAHLMSAKHHLRGSGARLGVSIRA